MNRVSRRDLGRLLCGAAAATGAVSAATGTRAQGNLTFNVHANGLGKTIIVRDRVTNTEVFHAFVGPDAVQSVSVASPDGQVGDVDINAQMTADSPVFIIQSNYAVRAGETVEISDQ